MVAMSDSMITFRITATPGTVIRPSDFAGCEGSHMVGIPCDAIFRSAVVADDGSYAEVTVEASQPLVRNIERGFGRAEVDLLASAAVGLSAIGAPKTATCFVCHEPIERGETGPWRHGDNGSGQPKHPALPSEAATPAVPAAPWYRAATDANTEGMHMRYTQREQVIAVRYLPGEPLDELMAVAQKDFRYARVVEVPAWRVLLVQVAAIEGADEREVPVYCVVTDGGWLIYERRGLSSATNEEFLDAYREAGE